MKIPFACPSCAKAGVVDAGYVGRQARCKQCGHRFTIREPGDTTPDVYSLDAPEATPETADAIEPEPGSTFVAARGDQPTRPSGSRPARRDTSSSAAQTRRKDGSGFAWRAWLVGVVAVVAVALVAVALVAPNGKLIAGIALLGLGSVMVLVGYCAGAYGAFCEDFLYGFLYLVIPLYTAYYLATRWEDLWVWITCSTAGVGLILLGTEVVRWAGVTV